MKKQTKGILTTVGLTVLGGIAYLLKKNADEKEPDEYSSKWFDSLSDEELDKEREKVRLEYCSSGDDFDRASSLQRLLWHFDDIIRARHDDGSEPGYPVHREHGWHLLEDDD